MRNLDLISFGLSALRRHKLRTLLTVLGVTIGAATLVVSLSVGLGVNKVIEEQFAHADDLRQITVFPSNDHFEDSFEGVPDDVLDVRGDMSEAKRERIRKLKAMRWKHENLTPSQKPLTEDRVDQLRRIPHVVDVVPELDQYGRAYWQDGNESAQSHVYAVPFAYKRYLDRIEAGSGFTDPRGRQCIIHEYLLYRLGVRNDADVQAAIGQQLRIELRNSNRSPVGLLGLLGADLSNISKEEMDVLEELFKKLPDMMQLAPLPAKEKAVLLKVMGRKAPSAKKKEDKRISEDFTIVGVIRAHNKDDKPGNSYLDGLLDGDAEIIIPQQAGEEFFLQLPQLKENGFSRVRLFVDHDDHLESVAAEVRKLGLNEFSMGVFARQVRKNTLLIGFAMDFIALVALVVAALGITNTMFTTVLERTREIGILKAVGARDRQILFIFLVEGGLIGVAGGVFGVVMGWLASFPGNDYAIRILAKQDHHPLPTTVFLYPAWLLVCVPLFAVAMTTLAALLPAGRAARVQPVVALRHE